MNTVNENLENKMAESKAEENIVITSIKPDVTNYEGLGYTQQEWDGIPHAPKTQSDEANDLPEIDETSELGMTETFIWKKLSQSGVMKPSYGMEPLRGKFDNLSAIISDDGENKCFIVTGECHNHTFEKVTLDCFDVFAAVNAKFDRKELVKKGKVLATMAKAEHFYYWVNRYMSEPEPYEEFLQQLWDDRALLPVRVSYKAVNLQRVLASILLHTSTVPESYYFQKEGLLLLKSKDIEMVANGMGVKASRIINELNHAGLLLRSNFSTGYQIKVRLGDTTANVYAVRIINNTEIK